MTEVWFEDLSPIAFTVGAWLCDGFITRAKNSFRPSAASERDAHRRTGDLAEETA